MKKIIKKTAIGGILLILILAGAAPYVLPGAATRMIRSTLEKQGIIVQDLRLRNISASGLDASHIVLGKSSQVKIDSLRVDYAIGDLGKARVDTITVSGLEIELDLDEDLNDQGLLPKTSEASETEIPFKNLILKGCSLTLSKGDLKFQVPFKGALGKMEDHLNVGLTMGPQSYRYAWAGREFTATDLLAELKLEIDDRFKLQALEVQTRLPQANIAGEIIREITFQMKGDKEEPHLAFNFQAHGNNWGFSNAQGEITHLLEYLSDVNQTETRKFDGRISIHDLYFTNETVEARFPLIQTVSAIQLKNQVPQMLAAHVTAHKGRIVENATNFIASGLSFTLQLPTNLNQHAEASFQLDSLSAGGYDLPGLNGTCRISPTGLQTEVRWDAIGTNQTIKANLTLEEKGEEREIRLKVDPIRFEYGTPLDGISVDITGWNMQGSIGMSGAIPLWTTEQPKLHLHIHELNLSKEGASVDGITGNVVFDRFDPLGTPGNQKLKIKKVTIDKLTLDDGMLAFQLEDPESILIEKTDWAFAGGRVSVFSTRYTQSKPSLETIFFMDGIEVGELMELLMSDTVQGTGKLSGKIPVYLAWKPTPKFRIRGGFLYATVDKGKFSVNDDEMLNQIIDATIPHIKVKRKDLKKDLKRSLKNFEYNSLEVEFKNAPRPTGRIHLQGKGAQERGLDLDLDIRFQTDKL